MQRARVLVAGLVATLVVVALAVVVRSIGRSPEPTRPGTIDALATSRDACVTCHRKSSPGIVEQYGHSTMAAAGVRCQDCHEVEKDHPGAVAHQGTFVLAEPTTATCAKCHQNEVAQFSQSRHGLPAYVAYAGSKDLSAAQLAEYRAIPEGGFARITRATHSPPSRASASPISPVQPVTPSARRRRTARPANAGAATCGTSSASSRRASPRPAPGGAADGAAALQQHGSRRPGRADAGART